MPMQVQPGPLPSQVVAPSVPTSLPMLPSSANHQQNFHGHHVTRHRHGRHNNNNHLHYQHNHHYQHHQLQLQSSSNAREDYLPSQITTHLFVGNQDQTKREILNKLNITYILSLQTLPKFLDQNNSENYNDTHENENDEIRKDNNNSDTTNQKISSSTSPTPPHSMITNTNKQQQIRGKFINVSDNFEQLLGKVFEEAYNFIEEARRNKCNILVHCNAGISRSPTIAIAYLMKWKHLHFQEAYQFVKRCRPQISPNLNFIGQLVSYEQKIRKQPISSTSNNTTTTTTNSINSQTSKNSSSPTTISSRSTSKTKSNTLN